MKQIKAEAKAATIALKASPKGYAVGMAIVKRLQRQLGVTTYVGQNIKEKTNGPT